VLRLPRIANFDDFGPLAAEPGVRLRYIERPAALGVPDLVVLPGSKSTLADLAWLRATGLGPAVLRLAAAGVPVLGICGGFQLLGQRLCDPEGLDGAPGEAAGLGLLAVETVFRGRKTTRQVTGRVVARGDGVFGALHGQLFSGYEIHVGRTASALPPFALLDSGCAPPREGRGEAPHAWASSEGGAAWSGRDSGAMPDGAVAPDGLVAGTYVHGLFHNDGLRRALLGALAARRGVRLPAAAAPLADPFDRLADAVAASVDLRRLYALCGLPV
jgi:adenosylcobyric acid synthase